MRRVEAAWVRRAKAGMPVTEPRRARLHHAKHGSTATAKRPSKPRHGEAGTRKFAVTRITSAAMRTKCDVSGNAGAPAGCSPPTACQIAALCRSSRTATRHPREESRAAYAAEFAATLIPDLRNRWRSAHRGPGTIRIAASAAARDLRLSIDINRVRVGATL